MTDTPHRGRPPLKRGETSARITVRVTNDQYDRAFSKSRRERVSMPDVMRRALDKLLADEDEGD